MSYSDIYPTVLGDTWDLISYRVYGSHAYVNELMAANPDHMATVIFGAGERLVCPDIALSRVTPAPAWKG